MFKIIKQPEKIYFEVTKEAIVEVNGKQVVIQRSQSFKDGQDDNDEDKFGYSELTEEEQYEFDEAIDDLEWRGE